jgi:hypothetical protein
MKSEVQILSARPRRRIMGSTMPKEMKVHVTGSGACMLNKCSSRLRKRRKRIGQKKARRVKMAG